MKAFILVLLLGAAVSAAGAQRPDSAAAQPNDAIFARARQLVLEGNGVAGRALIDSMVTATANTPAQVDALFWRASLAATASEAERDYRRIIVEHPLSPRGADALLGVAQLEMSRGDREAATYHLQRFLLENASHEERGRAGIWLARLLIEQGKAPRGCAVLASARASIGADAVELRNQLDYYSERCVGVDTTTARPVVVATSPRDTARPAAAPVTPRTEPVRQAPRVDSAKTPPRTEPTRVTPPPATTPSTAPARVPATTVPSTATRPAPATQYTVQVAAFEPKSEADQLAARLKQRGLASRVFGIERPFRVRIGQFRTQDEAATLLRTLRGQGMNGFVTVAEQAGAPR